jgi:hypothetical protein
MRDARSSALPQQSAISATSASASASNGSTSPPRTSSTPSGRSPGSPTAASANERTPARSASARTASLRDVSAQYASTCGRRERLRDPRLAQRIGAVAEPRALGRDEAQLVHAEQVATDLVESLEQRAARIARARIGREQRLVEPEQPPDVRDRGLRVVRQARARNQDDAVAQIGPRHLERDDLEPVARHVANRLAVAVGAGRQPRHRAVPLELRERLHRRFLDTLAHTRSERVLHERALGGGQGVEREHTLEQAAEVDVSLRHEGRAGGRVRFSRSGKAGLTFNRNTGFAPLRRDAGLIQAKQAFDPRSEWRLEAYEVEPGGEPARAIVAAVPP